MYLRTGIYNVHSGQEQCIESGVRVLNLTTTIQHQKIAYTQIIDNSHLYELHMCGCHCAKLYYTIHNSSNNLLSCFPSVVVAETLYIMWCINVMVDCLVSVCCGGCWLQTDEDGEIYMSVMQLRDETDELQLELERRERSGDARGVEACKQQLNRAQQQLLEKNRLRSASFVLLLPASVVYAVVLRLSVHVSQVYILSELMM